MTNQMKEQIKQVNQLLLEGEPHNISVDTFSHFTGYKPQYLVDAMNEVFDIGAWGFEDLSNEIIPLENGGGLVIAQVKVWLKGVEFQPTGYGQARVTKGDQGDAKKGAQTDAMKKALSYFSVGNRAYQGLLPNPKEDQSNNNRNGARPAINRPTNGAVREQPTNNVTSIHRTPVTPAATSSIPTQVKTAQPQENKKFVKVEEKPALAELPTVSQLQADVKELQIVSSVTKEVMQWKDVLGYACRKDIKDGKVTLEALVEAGTQLHPQYAEKVAGFVAAVRQGRANKQEASTGK